MKNVFFLCVCITLLNCNTGPETQKETNAFAIAIHGGAGVKPAGTYTTEQENAYHAKMQEALQLGYSMLANGDSAVNVVEAVIKIMEDSPLFNAGRGSVLTGNGKIKMDAAIMNGQTLDAGAVNNVRRIKNPISAAKAIMLKSKYILISSGGAERFASDNGLEMVNPAYFYTQHQVDRWIKSKDSLGYENSFIDSLVSSGNLLSDNADALSVEKNYGTVGCVVKDKYGNLAAGTSTGGLFGKKYNRVGDSPLIGSGTYANNKTCAVSCTGNGEDFIKTVASKTVSDLMEYKNYALQQSVDTLFYQIFTPIAGEGGLVSIDKFGNIVFQYNTAGMFRGFADAEGNIRTFIYAK